MMIKILNFIKINEKIIRKRKKSWDQRSKKQSLKMNKELNNEFNKDLKLIENKRIEIWKYIIIKI